MAITLAIKIDQSKHGGDACLLESNGYTPRSGALRGIAGDQIPIQLFFRTVGDNASTAYEVSASEVSFGSDLVPSSAFTGATDAGTGDTVHVAAVLDLTSLTSDLIDLLDENDEQEVQLDFSVAEASGNRLTYRIPMIIAKQAATGSASVAVGITITQPGGTGTPFVITGPGRTQEL